MRARLVIPAAVVVASVCALIGPSRAWAGDPGGQNSWGGASANGGQLTVQAGGTYWTPPAGSSWAKQTESDPSAGQAGPQPALRLHLPGPRVEWDAAARRRRADAGPVGDPDLRRPRDDQPDAADLGHQCAAGCGRDPGRSGGGGRPNHPTAAAQLSDDRDGTPGRGSEQLVGVATWLWIEPGAWQTLTATASAGTVTTTATATPTKVVWDMGDGSTVTCDGPGTPYDPNDPTATTDCSYTWTQAGSYQVTATIYWSVSWTAVGAPGGGNLGLKPGPPSQMAVRVTESQAINTPVSGGN